MTREKLDAAGDWAFPARHTPEHTPGMTLRDYFAAHSLAAMLNASSNIDQAAFFAYQLADAMLKERK